MSGIVTVERFTNVVHIYFPTEGGPIVTVSLYGHKIDSYLDKDLISLAQEELKRKLDSKVFALVSVLPKGSKLLCERCAILCLSQQTLN